jgi:putative transposase
MDALKRVDAGLAVPDVCRELGISSATFYKWRAKYGGMDTSMMARMKELEAENARLKKMYADERLKSDILQEYARHEIGPYIPGLNFSDFCLHQYGDSNDRTFDILGQPSQGY